MSWSSPVAMPDKPCDPEKTAQSTCCHYSGAHAKQDGWMMGFVFVLGLSDNTGALNTHALANSQLCSSRLRMIFLSRLGCRQNMPFALKCLLPGLSPNSTALRMKSGLLTQLSPGCPTHQLAPPDSSTSCQKNQDTSQSIMAEQKS